MQDILINWSPQETRVALVEHGAVQELHVERTLERLMLALTRPYLAGSRTALLDYVNAGGNWTGSDAQLANKGAGVVHLIVGSGEYQLY